MVQYVRVTLKLVASTSIVTVMTIVVMAVVAVIVMTVVAVVMVAIVASMVTASVVSASVGAGELFGGLCIVRIITCQTAFRLWNYYKNTLKYLQRTRIRHRGERG